MGEKARILCVDDEQKILNAIQRNLRNTFEIETADSGQQGLDLLRATRRPFQVVVSDMKMPHMNGATFLRHVRREFPDTVRILLTGFAELDTVIEAVNEGHIFRFIAKPCPARALLEAFNDAVKQHDLMTAERVLLEETVKGSVEALTGILSLASPALFGRATRIRELALLIAREVDVRDLWQLEVAASFSQIGCISLPDQTAGKLFNGEDLNDNEQQMIERVPEITLGIIGQIPRLEPVVEILTCQTKNFDGSGPPKGKMAGTDIPLAARILKLACRCEELQTRGYSRNRVYDTLRVETGVYDPDLVEIYRSCAPEDDGSAGVRGVSLHELRIGMIFNEAVKSAAGLLLVAPGAEVSESLLARIQNYDATIGLEMPLWIRNEVTDDDANVPAEDGETPAENPHPTEKFTVEI